MKRCKLFILCCLMMIAAAENGKAKVVFRKIPEKQKSEKQKPQEWQIRGALAETKALNQLVDFF